MVSVLFYHLFRTDIILAGEAKRNKHLQFKFLFFFQEVIGCVFAISSP